MPAGAHGLTGLSAPIADVSGDDAQAQIAVQQRPLHSWLTVPPIRHAAGHVVPVVDPAVRCAPAAIFVLPDYSGTPWATLPNLRRGAGELAALFEDRGTHVCWPAFTSMEELTQTLDDSVHEDGEPLLVYVGGHGIVQAGRHYTALDPTPPHSPSPGNALSSVRLAELLAAGGRDVLVMLDSSFAGEGAVGMIGEAVSALKDTPGTRAFAVVASCGAFESVEDGVFIAKLLELVRGGPRHDVNAWGPGDERIRVGALSSELRQAGLHVVTGNLALRA
ncbi:MAG: hypothetical protein ACR2H2_09255 [Solirubrobacteraceae bacterium]